MQSLLCHDKKLLPEWRAAPAAGQIVVMLQEILVKMVLEGVRLEFGITVIVPAMDGGTAYGKTSAS